MLKDARGFLMLALKIATISLLKISLSRKYFMVNGKKLPANTPIKISWKPTFKLI